jgi:hypothetical protein
MHYTILDVTLALFIGAFLGAATVSWALYEDLAAALFLGIASMLTVMWGYYAGTLDTPETEV